MHHPPGAQGAPYGLEQFSWWCSEAIASVAEVVGTFGRGEGRESGANGGPQAGDRAGRGSPQAGFEFGKDLLNGIEVGAVGGQVEQAGADGLNRLPHARDFMARQIVHDDAVAGVEGGREDLFDIGHKAGPIDRAVQNHGGGEVLRAQGGNEGGRFPVAVGDFGDEARPAPTPTVAPGQIRPQGRLVQEDQAVPVEVGRLGAPALPGRHHIRAILFRRVQDFFLRSSLSGARRATPWAD